MITSLVTGGAGFIGSHIVDTLLKKGHRVINIDNEFSDNEFFYWNKNSENHKIDIRNYDELKILFKNVDYVFHCAAEARIGPAIKNPIETASNNFTGTCTVLQCARENNIKKLVYSSTSSGYGNNPCPNHEMQPDECLNPYSVSKIAGEKLCKMYTSLYGLKTIIFRYFNVFGERAPTSGQYCPVVGIFLKQKQNGDALTIVGDGTQKRDFIYVGDVANANFIAATKDISNKLYGEIFNIGSGENISINEIANIISKNQIYLPKREGEVDENLANIEKAKKYLDWTPKVPIKKWIKSQINSLN